MFTTNTKICGSSKLSVLNNNLAVVNSPQYVRVISSSLESPKKLSRKWVECYSTVARSNAVSIVH
jgi:hypothetical protein